MKPVRSGVGLLGLVLVSASCTWVRLTPNAEQVRVLPAAETAGCQKVGTVTSTTQNRVGIFARSDRKVAEELAFLARNEAAAMQGNAVTPLAAPSDGRQSFEVYRCED